MVLLIYGFPNDISALKVFIVQGVSTFSRHTAGVIYDVNWHNFYPKHFSCLRSFEKLLNIANIDIFEKLLP